MHPESAEGQFTIIRKQQPQGFVDSQQNLRPVQFVPIIDQKFPITIPGQSSQIGLGQTKQAQLLFCTQTPMRQQRYQHFADLAAIDVLGTSLNTHVASICVREALPTR